MKLWLFVLRLSCSGRAFHVAFATHAQEAFLTDWLASRGTSEIAERKGARAGVALALSAAPHRPVARLGWSG